MGDFTYNRTLHYWLVQSGKDENWLRDQIQKQETSPNEKSPRHHLVGTQQRKEEGEHQEFHASTILQSNNVPILRNGQGWLSKAVLHLTFD